MSDIDDIHLGRTLCKKIKISLSPWSYTLKSGHPKTVNGNIAVLDQSIFSSVRLRARDFYEMIVDSVFEVDRE